MYGKYFAQTFHGSMCGVGVVKHAVWGYCISHASSVGRLEIHPVEIAASIGDITPKQVKDAIAYLMAPDPESRNQEFEGRKLRQISGYEYELINFESYQKMRSNVDRQEYNRVKQAESRKRKKLREQFQVPPADDFRDRHEKSLVEGALAKVWVEEQEEVRQERIKDGKRPDEP